MPGRINTEHLREFVQGNEDILGLSLREWIELRVEEDKDSVFLQEPIEITEQLVAARMAEETTKQYQYDDIHEGTTQGVMAALYICTIDLTRRTGRLSAKQDVLPSIVDFRKLLSDIAAKCIETDNLLYLHNHLQLAIAEEQLDGFEEYMQDVKYELCDTSQYEYFISAAKAMSYPFAVYSRLEEEKVFLEFEKQFS